MIKPLYIYFKYEIQTATKTYISNLVRTTHFWNNIYHVQAQNLKIGKPNNFKVFGINVFKQKQTNKKLKQKETQKTTNKQKTKTKTKKQKTKHTNKNK